MKLAEAQALHVGSLVVYQSQGYSVKNITGVSGKFPTLELVSGDGSCTGSKTLKVSARFVGVPARLGATPAEVTTNPVIPTTGPEITKFATEVLQKVEQRYNQDLKRREELVASRDMLDAEIKRIDSFLEAVTGKLQSISDGFGLNGLGLTSPTQPIEAVQSEALVKPFAGKDLRTCVQKLLTDHPNGLSIGYLAKRINKGGYKGRKATTLARTRQSLASMLYEDCNSTKPTFKNISRGMYALSKRSPK